MERHLPIAVQWIVFAALVTLLPVIAYHTIEAPGIALGRRLAARMLKRAPREYTRPKAENKDRQ